MSTAIALNNNEALILPYPTPPTSGHHLVTWLLLLNVSAKGNEMTPMMASASRIRASMTTMSTRVRGQSRMNRSVPAFCSKSASASLKQSRDERTM